MKAPKETIRTTLIELFDEPYDALYDLVYVMALAPYGILYVGRTTTSISERMRLHFILGPRLVDKFMRRLSPMELCEMRVDLLLEPEKGWMKKAEIELIKYFKPMFNTYYV